MIGLLLLPSLLLAPAPARAAELLQVREATLLQVGDSNRSYGVLLACVGVEAGQEAAATAWLRQRVPRGTPLNLRPVGQRDGVLLARVSTRAARGQLPLDLGTALMAEGLATPLADADGLACGNG